MKSLTTDSFLNGCIQVKQNRSGYRFSIDAVLLAWHADPGAVGAAGAAYVFVRNAGAWSQEQKLYASSGGWDERFGAAIEGLTLEARGLAAGAIDTAIAGGGTLRYASLAQRYLDWTP